MTERQRKTQEDIQKGKKMKKQKLARHAAPWCEKRNGIGGIEAGLLFV